MRTFCGGLFIVLGVILTVWGLQASDSLSSEFNRFFNGTPSDRSLGLLLGGTAATILGLGLLARRRGERS